MENISLSTIKRLPLYYNLASNLLKTGKTFITSSFMSEIIGVDDTLVRKDIALIGCVGKPKFGYNVYDLMHYLEKFLGFNNQKNAVIIGVGNLGTALAKYENFKNYGLNIIALFDTDPNKINLVINKIKIFNITELNNICSKTNVEMAILTVPGEIAQSVTDTVIKSNIKTIWNFSQTSLSVPDGYFVWNQDLVSSFLTLSKLSEINKLKNK